MANPISVTIDFTKKLLLISVGAVGVGAISVPAIQAQSQQSLLPKFEVASVKPNKSQGIMDMGGANVKFHALRISLEGLIEYAYNINHNEIVGPAWLGSETYDIEAKPEHPVSIALIRQMLQTLLAERFKLKVHTETERDCTSNALAQLPRSIDSSVEERRKDIPSLR